MHRLIIPAYAAPMAKKMHLCLYARIAQGLRLQALNRALPDFLTSYAGRRWLQQGCDAARKPPSNTPQQLSLQAGANAPPYAMTTPGSRQQSSIPCYAPAH